MSSSPSPPEPPRSGLRNPNAAVRGVGAGTLAVEALVLLLALAPLAEVGGPHRGAAIGVALVLALACLLAAGLLGRTWAWYAAAAIQLILIACGLLNPALAVIGLLFGAVWGYALSVRRTVLGTRR